MRSMQKLFFSAWQVEMGHSVFLIFHNFQKNENIALLHFNRKKKTYSI